MKGVILQHWSGEMNELGRLSSANISAYAERLGVDYQLLRGAVFRPGLSAPCQKLHMLDEVFDPYDIVVMVDADMFAVRGLTESIFDVEGTGLFSTHTESIFSRCRERHPQLTDKQYAYWGGAIYRLPRGLRIALRAKIVESELQAFSGNFEDEGIMHRLATLARVKQDKIPQRWCQCSYLPNPERAAMIHIRTKVTPTGPKAPKIDNYGRLRGMGVIE